jgi:(p)ppGpp synthase/HD superfamily hydrolase
MVMGERGIAERARAFAVEAHAADRYGDAPYSVHLDAVAAVLRAAGFCDDEDLAVGYLHDVIEDTGTSEATLAALFGAEVAAAVAFCTDAPGPDRTTRKGATFARMKASLATDAVGAWRGCRVKVADRLANVLASVRDAPEKLAVYRSEQPAFRDALYRPGACDALWEALETALASDGAPSEGA